MVTRSIGPLCARRRPAKLDIHKIPGVNHPVFKDNPVNYDSREVWVNNLFTQRAEYNVFDECYHELVEELFKSGGSRNVYCVNYRRGDLGVASQGPVAAVSQRRVDR